MKLGIGVIVIFISVLATASPKKNNKAALKYIQSPTFAIKWMNSEESRWEVLKVLRKYLSASDYNYLKLKGDQLGINYKEPMNIRVNEKNGFLYDGQIFQFSADGKTLSVRGQKIPFNERSSLRDNYKMVQESVNKILPRKSAQNWLIPTAHAASANDSTTYNLMVLLYGVNKYQNNHGVINFERYMKDKNVKKALNALGSKKIQSMNCDELGMNITYEDGSKGYVTFEKRKFKRISDSQGGNSVETEAKLSKKEASLAEMGWSTYCQQMSPEEQQEIIQLFNLNLISPSDNGESGNVAQ